VEKLRSEIVRTIDSYILASHYHLSSILYGNLGFLIFVFLDQFSQEQIEKVKEEGDEALYNRLDLAYSTDDDNSEVSLSLSLTHTHTHCISFYICE